MYCHQTAIFLLLDDFPGLYLDLFTDLPKGTRLPGSPIVLVSLVYLCPLDDSVEVTFPTESRYCFSAAVSVISSSPFQFAFEFSKLF